MDKKLAQLIKQDRAERRKFKVNKDMFNFNRFGPLLFLLIFSGLGATYLYQSQASPDPAANKSEVMMWLSKAANRPDDTNNLTLDIWVDSQNKPVNAVQPTLTYPTDKLEYVSADTGGSQFTVQVATNSHDGQVTFARGSLKPLTGKQLAGTVTFKVLTRSGAVDIGLTAESQLLSSNTNTNILTKLQGGRYNLTN